MGDQPYAMLLPWIFFAVVARHNGEGIVWGAIAALIAASTLLVTTRRPVGNARNTIAIGAIIWFSALGIAGLVWDHGGWLSHDSRVVSALGFVVIAFVSLAYRPATEYYSRACGAAAPLGIQRFPATELPTDVDVGHRLRRHRGVTFHGVDAAHRPGLHRVQLGHPDLPCAPSARTSAAATGTRGTTNSRSTTIRCMHSDSTTPTTGTSDCETRARGLAARHTPRGRVRAHAHRHVRESGLAAAVARRGRHARRPEPGRDRHVDGREPDLHAPHAQAHGHRGRRRPGDHEGVAARRRIRPPIHVGAVSGKRSAPRRVLARSLRCVDQRRAARHRTCRRHVPHDRGSDLRRHRVRDESARSHPADPPAAARARPIARPIATGRSRSIPPTIRSDPHG